MEYFTSKELSDKFNICKETIYRYSKKGKIRTIKNTYRNLYNAKDIENLIKSKKLKSVKNHSFSNEDFIREVFNKIGKNYKVLSKYKGQKTKIKIKHLVCNTIYYANPSNILYNKNKCPYCFGTHKKNIEDYKMEVEKLTNKEFIVVSKNYTNNKSKILYKHIKCNNTFYMRPNDFNRRLSCPKCQYSKGEKEIENFLIKNNIDYKSQYKYKRFFIDFCIKCEDNTKMFIEHDGLQHFKPYFKVSDNNKDKSLKIQIKRDCEKEKLISKEKDIILIRISYQNINNLNKILKEVLLEEGEFNDYPLGEYSKVRGNVNYPNIIYIG